MAKQVNNDPSSPAFYFLFISIPVWAFLARSSNNLLVDGLIYDGVITISYAMTFIILGYSREFNLWQWSGVILTIVGMVLMKLEGK